jgi:hypothetical protein
MFWSYRLTSHLGLEVGHEPRLDVEFPGKASADRKSASAT